MNRHLNKVLALLLLPLFFQLTSCETLHDWSQGNNNEPPEITGETSLPDALSAAIKFGSPTLEKVVEIVSYKRLWPQAEPLLYTDIENKIYSYKNPELVRAFKLYAETDGKNADVLFDRVVRVSRPFVKRFAWSLAIRFPGNSMGDKIRKFLDQTLYDNNLEDNLFTETARAIDLNQVTSVYSILYQGLLLKNDEAFARVMYKFSPARASYDFLTYMSQAEFSELRQIHFSSVDASTCLYMLKVMQDTPPEINHPGFSNLFNYAVSRNRSIAEAANELIMLYVPDYNDQVAFTLATLPTEVQLAFVENARRKQTPLVNLFLKKLKTMTARDAVREELDTIQF